MSAPAYLRRIVLGRLPAGPVLLISSALSAVGSAGAIVSAWLWQRDWHHANATCGTKFAPSTSLHAITQASLLTVVCGLVANLGALAYLHTKREGGLRELGTRGWWLYIWPVVGLLSLIVVQAVHESFPPGGTGCFP